VSAEIKEATGEDALLVPSSGGIFDVKVDGNLVFSKHKVARFPQPGEISQLLAE
jgi:selT/selW/selH-like putative selenoprotein